VVKQAIKVNPVLAFAASARAYQTFAYPVEIRRQLGGAFLAAMSSGRAKIQPSAGALVWLVSQSVSPHDASGLVARAGYLLNHGRQTEIAWIAERLKTVAPWSVETWTIDTYRWIYAGDRNRAQASLERAIGTGRLEDAIRTALEGAIGRMK
jgi:hypothetical protein